DLVARSPGERTGRQQDHGVGVKVVLTRDRFAYHGGDRVGIARVCAYIELHGHDEALLALDLHRERGRPEQADRRMAALHARLDVLRVVIVPSHDDQFLETPRDEELALVHETEVARPEEWPAPIGEVGLKGRGGVLRTVPVPGGDVRASEPDLADLVGRAR